GGRDARKQRWPHAQPGAGKNAPRHNIVASSARRHCLDRTRRFVMDDIQPIAIASDTCYQCPGESRPIDRSTHLNRLATFFHACRYCDQRRDVELLTRPQARHWARIIGQPDSRARLTNEGLEAGSLNDLTTAEVDRFTKALGAVVTQDGNRRGTQSTVIVGGDGHWATAPLVATACGALRLTG